MTVTVRKDRTGDLMKAIRELTRKEVLVGIPADTAARSGEASGGINNALIGYLMENGEPDRNLPARPHLVPGVQDATPQITAQFQTMAKVALSGDVSAIDRGYHAIGLIAQASVQKRITDGPFTPLSEQTLKRRKAKGRKGTKPLIDTGAYRQAQRYVVRDKGGR